MPFLAGKTVGGGALPLDRDECRRALGVLLEPFADAVELRPLPHAGGFRVLPAGDLDGLTAAAEAMCANGQQVYYTLNPIPVGLDHSARVGDVLRRRWLLVDVDPVKDPAHKDDSASDSEKEAAGLAAEKVLWWLTDQGWPAPVVIDSGNGYHLLWRIDLENTPHSQSLIKRVLYVLAKRFDGPGAKIDRSVHNASRIAKLPGSWARKGPNTDDRPWRPVRLLSVPLVRAVVSAEQLAAAVTVQADATIEAALETPAPEANGNGHAGGFLRGKAEGERRAYGRAALEREVARVALAPVGERNNALNRAAFSLGQLVAGGELQEAEVVGALSGIAKLKGLTDSEIVASIRSGLEAGKGDPRKAPEKPGKIVPEGRLATAADAVPKGEPIIVRASSITPRKVEWLWPGRIPIGKMTTFAGQGGLGKTFVLCDISARITQGLDWPDSEGLCCEQGQVLFITGEDDFDDTIVPRLIELGADLTRVAFLRNEVQDRFTIADLETLDRALDGMGAGVRMVAIDPPAAFLGEVDDHKNAEVRSLLSPLKTWCARRRVAVVFNTHFNKAAGQKVEAMQRVMASVAWVNAVRTAHAFAADPEDFERVFFVPMKSNVGRKKKGLAYRIIATKDDLARVEWLGEVDVSADQAVSGGRTKEKRAVEAAAWLASIMPGDGGNISSKEVWDRAREAGVSDYALKEAKKKLAVRAVKISDEDGSQAWYWHWPPTARQRWEERQPARESEAEL